MQHAFQRRGRLGPIFSRGTIAITGFGYFCRAGRGRWLHVTTNTALGVGAKYPDRQSKFFESAASYVLLTITREKMIVDLKALDGGCWIS